MFAALRMRNNIFICHTVYINNVPRSTVLLGTLLFEKEFLIELHNLLSDVVETLGRGMTQLGW